MTSLMPFDELNAFKQQIETDYSFERLDKSKVEDALLDILIMAYVYGHEQANRMLETETQIDEYQMRLTIEEKVAGKTWRERLNDGLSVQEILRIAETEMHRVYNESEMDTAFASGRECNKVWVTMLDDRVRDTHSYLEGMEVPLDARFYTYDGDSAEHPGGFEYAENNVNCRCELLFIPV